MTLKSVGKFVEKLTLASENDIRNLVNYNASSGKSENLHLDVILLSKVYMFEPKRAEELCVITLENDAKFEEEMTCALKNDMRNLANFDLTLESLKIFSLMGSFWFKVFLKCRYSYPFGLRYSLYLICIVSPYP